MKTIAAISMSMPRADSDDTEDARERVSDTHSRDVPAIVGSNLRRLRKANGLSLERLAELSGVSRAMLGQIETAKSVPTVSLLWRVADALGVPVATLVATEREPSVLVVKRDSARVLVSSEGRFASRNLSPDHRQRSTGFFELSLAAGHKERFAATDIGTRHNLVVSVGRLALSVANEPLIVLEQGDAIAFEGSTAWEVENTSLSGAIAYLVVSAPTP